MFMRIGLFLATNIAVLLLLSILAKLFGLDYYAARHGTNFGSMLIMAGVMGFVGSFISLAISKKMALWSTGAQIITAPQNADEQWLVSTVHRLADQAGIGKPDVAIYGGPEMNAFATGMNKNKALVAVSVGLMQQMNRDQVEAVLAHEVGHVANGDMVTMALLQGVLNTFVIFLSRVLGSIIDGMLRGNRDDDRGPGFAYFIIVNLLQIVLGIFASMIAMWFSRRREFRADAWGAKLAGRAKMISALERLDANHGASSLPPQVQAFGISGALASGLSRLFMSHPPIAERVATLRQSA
jgi:heat shock protein HtpX